MGAHAAPSAPGVLRERVQRRASRARRRVGVAGGCHADGAGPKTSPARRHAPPHRGRGTAARRARRRGRSPSAPPARHRSPASGRRPWRLAEMRGSLGTLRCPPAKPPSVVGLCHRQRPWICERAGRQARVPAPLPPRCCSPSRRCRRAAGSRRRCCPRSRCCLAGSLERTQCPSPCRPRRRGQTGGSPRSPARRPTPTSRHRCRLAPPREFPQKSWTSRASWRRADASECRRCRSRRKPRRLRRRSCGSSGSGLPRPAACSDGRFPDCGGARPSSHRPAQAGPSSALPPGASSPPRCCPHGCWSVTGPPHRPCLRRRRAFALRTMSFPLAHRRKRPLRTATTHLRNSRSGRRWCQTRAIACPPTSTPSRGTQLQYPIGSSQRRRRPWRHGKSGLGARNHMTSCPEAGRARTSAPPLAARCPC
mmetsp:Transcript_119913/g.344552  ORF Transcript_119913/g.344552 Transcript_119913/m.344552 type:complete len:423 (+) Transcript_119913:558-1826(+)